MATQEPSQLPQYYGQQLQDGTMIENPMALRQTSSDSKQELLRLPSQPNQAHIDPTLDPFSSPMPLTQQTASRRLGSFTDPDYASPTSTRGHRTTPSQDYRSTTNILPRRNPNVEDHFSDEEYYDPQTYRRRTSRAHRPPPSAHSNDPSRYPSRRTTESHKDSKQPPPPTITAAPNNDSESPLRRLYSYAATGRDGAPPSLPPAKEVMRLPWAIWMGSRAKNHFVAFVGEFVGTTMFLFFAFSGTQVANIGSSASSGSNTTTGESTGFSPNVLLYIALVFSFSLMVNVWIFFRISGGLFNPAVTLGMLMCRALEPVRAGLLVAAQILGGVFSSYLVKVLFPTQFNVRTTLGGGTSLAQGVFIEAVLTAELVFTIFMLAKEKHKGMFFMGTGFWIGFD